jgi:dUTP pyrophosphatase
MRFEKITFEEWKKFFYNNDANEWTEEELHNLYEAIQLPKAGSEYAAGHDFYCPIFVTITPERPVLIPTGIRWVPDILNMDKSLLLVPRSGLGTKYGMRLLNSIGVIDADYQFAANEGHIMAFVDVKKELTLMSGDRFMQGIIVQYFRCGEESDNKRSGGFGSTGV